MNNDSKMISASEINRYTYCHYQWYYERLYGAKHIRDLYKKRNEELGYDDSSKSNFIKGQEFHESYPLREQTRRVVRAAVILALLTGLVIICFVLLQLVEGGVL